MADNEIFSLDMDNLEQFPVDLNSNDNNFNVNLNNEDQNFYLDTSQEDEDFTVDFGEVINLGTTDYERLQHLPQINGVTLIGNKTTEDLGIEADNSYDASWLFAVSTASQQQYDELLEAVTEKKRIFVTSAQETFNALAYINEEHSLTIVVNVGGINTYDDIPYADNIVAYFIVDKDTLAVSAEIGETDGASLARAIGNLTTNLTNEITTRYNADIGLQNQIDAITVSSDVIDVVGTYQDLQNYDTQHVKANDIIKVLQDSTHNNAISYYRWVVVSNVGSWTYVGSEGPYYTKGETDTLLSSKQATINSNNKLASDLVDDTNQTNKFVTENDITAWDEKADYGFTGIITGTSANPTDGASLANGTYLADPSKTSSYINLAMQDGTTKKQTIQKGGIVIRTAGRLIVLATQNLLYQYNTSQHYFYEGEPIVESYTRNAAPDEQCYLGTVVPPNNRIITDPIYLLDGEINTGTTGHVRIIFTVVDNLEDNPFEWSVTLSSGDDILFEDGAEPDFKEGHTYMLEFYGSTCQVLDFTESTGYSRDDLLKRFMRQNSNQIYYPSVDGLPVITVTKAVFNSTTRNISIGESQDIVIDGIHTLDYYNMVKYINLDLSPYNTATQSNMLQPYTQLPDGNYIVTNAGRIWFTTESYNCVPGEIIFKKGNEIAIIGLYGAVYYAYDTGTDEWSGGFFTTYADVQSMIAEANPMKNWTISKSTSATGNISLVDGRWTKKTRASGITSGSCSTPNNLTEVPDTYKSRFTLRTASTFTTFTVTQKADYKIYFDGDDCANGSITMLANKYYDVQFEADGFGDIIGHVHSYTLPSS